MQEVNEERRRAGKAYIDSILAELASGDDSDVAHMLPSILRVCASLTPQKDHEHFLLAVIEALAIALRARLDGLGNAPQLH
jgi:hypothetical protein